MASFGASCCLRSASKAKSIIIMAFFLTIPISKMMPIMPIIPKSPPDIIKANKAPTPAEGRVDRMVSGWI